MVTTTPTLHSGCWYLTCQTTLKHNLGQDNTLFLEFPENMIYGIRPWNNLFLFKSIGK